MLSDPEARLRRGLQARARARECLVRLQGELRKMDDATGLEGTSLPAVSALLRDLGLHTPALWTRLRASRVLALPLYLLALVNEQLWVGHFDMWSNGSVLLYRHAMLLGDEGLLSLAQAQIAVEAAVEECDRFYPAFQFVLWGDKTPAEALASSMVDAAGEA